MGLHKLVAILVSLGLLVYGLPRPAVGNEGRAGWTGSEEAVYAQREAASSHVETFAGGDAGALVTILVIAAFVFLIWYFVEHQGGFAMATPEETELVLLEWAALATPFGRLPSVPR